MSKVKQKVSGCFRVKVYAQAYCRISSYLQTMANKGCSPLVAIQMALAGEVEGVSSYHFERNERCSLLNGMAIQRVASIPVKAIAFSALLDILILGIYDLYDPAKMAKKCGNF